MSRRRGTAVAIALLLAALAAAGCGLGAGETLGEAELRVTKDYGAQPVLDPVGEEVSESDSVMRMLERNAEITTRYGGGFVQSIEGLEAEERGGRSFDWFYYVNGVEAAIGAADYSLEGDEAIWWDYRDWSAAQRVAAVVGSWPRPLLGGYEGKSPSVAIECMDGGRACEVARGQLESAGVSLTGAAPKGAIRVLVGPWDRVRQDPTAALLERGPEESGVFADFQREGEEFALRGLSVEGEDAREFGADAGLVAATRRYEAPPVWLVTGASPAGSLAAARALDASHLRDRYAVAIENGEGVALPLGQ